MTDTTAVRASWRFSCPGCQQPGLPLTGDDATCAACDVTYDCSDSVWNLLPAERAAFFSSFLKSYTRIRETEGRVSGDGDAYRQLPDCPATHTLAWQWVIRRRSFEALMTLLASTLERGSKVIDLGAGVGWLSNRLHEAGYSPCAVDLSADRGDGLGAARHFKGAWPRIVAEFDCLPLADEQADAAVFNGSFHYSTDYRNTLREAQRLVRPGGLIVILDTPVYKEQGSGKQMLAEQYDDFEKRFGDRSDSLAVTGYLTWSMLDELGANAGLRWRHRFPWYGLSWALRPFVAMIRRQREPAKFALLWAHRQ